MQSLEDAWQTKHWQHRTFAFILGVTEVNVMFAHNYLHPEEKMDLMRARKALAQQLLFKPFLEEDVRTEEEMLARSATVKRARLAAKASESHKLVSLSKNSAGKYAHIRCRTCGPLGCDGRRRRTTTICSCDPTVGVCRHCFAAHLLLFVV